MSNELEKLSDYEKKLQELRERNLARRIPQRRHTPMNNRMVKIQAPSVLTGLDGSRSPGSRVSCTTNTKAPKRRFNPGDCFEYDGSEWVLVYMYRIRGNPGVWFHTLMEIPKSEDVRPIDHVVVALGGGSTTPRIVFNEFASNTDASQYFWDIPRTGSSMIRTTQQLLQMKKLVS